jgi:lysophospholipase L1-like esterase
MHEFCLLKHCMVAQGRIGMFLISSMVLLNSCKAPDETTQNPLSNDSITGPLNGSSWRYLALGDSYTIGESVNPALRWPNQLQEELQANMITDAFETVTILATTGWTTSNLSLALANSDLEEESWDIVSLLIGVNNQYQGASLEEYAAQYENLLQRAIAAANDREDRVFVVSIPDYGYTPFGASNQAQISAELETFNAACKAITDSYGVAHFNITDISQQWPETKGLVAGDGLHPSGLQYEMWVDSFQEDVLGMLMP